MAKVLDRVYVHIDSCISGSSTVADAGSIWPRGPGEDGTGHSNSMPFPLSRPTSISPQIAVKEETQRRAE